MDPLSVRQLAVVRTKKQHGEKPTTSSTTFGSTKTLRDTRPPKHARQSSRKRNTKGSVHKQGLFHVDSQSHFMNLLHHYLPMLNFAIPFEHPIVQAFETFSLLSEPKDSLPCEAAEIMLKASREERGTVPGLAALSEDLDNVQTDAIQTFSLSPHHKTRAMSSETYRTLARTLCFRFPYTPVHCCGDEPLVRNSTPLNREATFYEYVVVNGRRYHASRTVGSNSSSLVHVTIPRAVPVATYGELLEICQFDCRSGHSVWFGRMRWFKPWCGMRKKYIPAHQWTYGYGSLESTPIKTPNCRLSSTWIGSLAD
ncbi:hypothetical protein F4604DRAFT_1927432 [Suillus subluteus]|nr:hypothetical protein F4604DRAFT_1927432 [Suillus subluteus]